MTYPTDFTLPTELLEQISGQGLEYLPELIRKYETRASRLANWMEQAIPEGFSVFAFPVEHRRRLRTTNMLERLSQEIRRRTRVVNIFPNEAACLRLTSAILMEIDEEWQTGRRYLSFEGSETPKDT